MTSYSFSKTSSPFLSFRTVSPLPTTEMNSPVQMAVRPTPSLLLSFDHLLTNVSCPLFDSTR
jgi:hypothetical protein